MIMKPIKLTHWYCKNPEYAAGMILHQVRGYLKAQGETINTLDLLKYIDEELAAETARLDKQFPDKKGRSRFE